MFVYTVEFVNWWDSESTHIVYTSEDLAWEVAMDEIESMLIKRGFDDPDCPEQHELYCEIHDLIVNDNYVDALARYDDIPDATNNYEDHIFIYVHTKEVLNSHTRTRSVAPIKKGVSVAEVKKQERSCQHCGKSNTYPDESVCWWCGNSPW